jgi:integrase
METLRRVLRWAVRKKTADGRRLLPEMPIDDWDFVPKEKNPHRPMLTSDAYAQMREKAWDVDPRIYVALVVCHETGHRLNAVRCLRWSDVDLTGRTLTWRGEHPKNGHDSIVPITETAVEALRRYQRHTGGIGEAWLFPGRTAGETLSRDQFYEWWKLVREAAELPPEVRLGFHAFRRKLASELATAPLAMVKALGGWKHPHVVVQVYQAPSVEQQRKVLENRQKFAAGE